MARLTDNTGRLLGGLAAFPFRGHLPPGTRTRLAPMYGPEETVRGLTCGYGSRAYAFSDRRRVPPFCHNPAETPDERHHCDRCGGDYCSLHAEPAAHDCAYVITDN